MGKLDIKQLKKLRESTGAPIMRVKQVLEEQIGDLPTNASHQAMRAGVKKVEKILKKEGFEKAAKRSGRSTDAGVIETYVHHSGKVASMVELLSETDFVARNDLFKELAHNLALQVASNDAKDAKTLKKQDFIKDPSKKISDLVQEVIAKTGENIRIGRISKIELGK